jgi:hypothetical protein
VDVVSCCFVPSGWGACCVLFKYIPVKVNCLGVVGLGGGEGEGHHVTDAAVCGLVSCCLKSNRGREGAP